MEQNIRVPVFATAYIAFQRTGYLVLQNNILFKMFARLIPLPSNRAYRKVLIETMLRRGSIKTAFNRDMADEYNEIKNHLPKKAAAVLDIGCGVAGIDIFLYRHYVQYPGICLHLLDKSEISSSIYYGFEKRGAVYNSLAVSAKFLSANGIPEGSIHLHEATGDSKIKLADNSIDLIISLISWGFHYPVGTYLVEAWRVLKPGGHLIVDVRKGTTGIEDISSRFTDIEIISESNKKIRCLTVKGHT